MKDYEEKSKCSICGCDYTHWGNNAEPVNCGRCCNTCNAVYVIPARISNMAQGNPRDFKETGTKKIKVMTTELPTEKKFIKIITTNVLD